MVTGLCLFISAAYIGLLGAVVVSVFTLKRIAIGTGVMSMTVGLANLITHPLAGKSGHYYVCEIYVHEKENPLTKSQSMSDSTRQLRKNILKIHRFLCNFSELHALMNVLSG